MKKTRIANLILEIYKIKYLRKICVKYLNKFEGGPFFSVTLRKILERYHGVIVGDYSYGECLKPGAWPAGVVVGRFVSVGEGVKVYLRNHPVERISMHPFFYNHKLGFVEHDTIDTGRLKIGHDAWLGSSAIILPGCCRIGNGAVIGAGAVVTKNVPDFAIVGGNPAQIIRYRFTEEEQRQILSTRWWENSIAALKPYINSLAAPVSGPLSSFPFSSPKLSNKNGGL